MDKESKTIPILFALLRSAIRSEKLTEAEQAVYSAELLPNLLKLAVKHDVAHLLTFGLKQNGLLTEQAADWEKYIFKAVYRYENMKYEYEKLCAEFEKKQIPFLPLKGAVLRAYYPEPWMRTSCDIDILVHEQDTEKAQAFLLEMGNTFHKKGSHDISFFTPTKVHVELHYELVEQGVANEAASVIKNVWRKAVVRKGYAFWYEMPDDMFYFYHIAHMAKHFENGGCGIRPLIDLWILDNLPEADVAKRNTLLREGKLLTFADAARKLSRVWLENEAHDDVSKQLENYILRGGVYGTNENRITVQQQKKGGAVQYALSKIFIPYEVIKFHYPILQKHRWLMPFMEVRRWGKLIFCGHLSRTTKELRYNEQISDEQAAKAQSFLESLGLL